MENKSPILEVRGLKQIFDSPRKWFKKSRHIYALNGVDLYVNEGETLGIVGESGSGKSTLLRSIIRLYKPTAGEIIFQGKNITRMSEKEFLPLRKDMQMIFQDPYASLDPHMNIKEIISEPLIIFKKRKLLSLGRHEIEGRVHSLIEKVGLSVDVLHRYPHEFSGGQRQRIGIARSLALNPRLILADEPVSALDVSIQGQVLNLMREVQQEFGLSYLFVAHDLAVVHYMADRIAVMYRGHVVEIAGSDDLYHRPRHPYTQALLASVPMPCGNKAFVPPLLYEATDDLITQKSLCACPFVSRCPYAQGRCREEYPILQKLQNNHAVACFFIKRTD